ncbi:hypothetical protein SEA_PHARAOH_33 [Mycobacterium phage Pharaoh]|uniref:Uncharacterized protein n=1 Tax=Mycobacterium phage Pharaoh TaxID=2530140 RepID=A0A481W2S0_9CAUD|nr:excisionase [Mycobacterium phage Pharaoh]QBJ00222.1 hypothetical protein SEA_PHARAOH_33 [Mycobacterium phage Pharaoh]
MVFRLWPSFLPGVVTLSVSPVTWPFVVALRSTALYLSTRHNRIKAPWPAATDQRAIHQIGAGAVKSLSRQKVASGVAAAGTVAVGGLAFALSFTALSDLASHAGVTPGQAWMVPLVIDGGVIVATAATVALQGRYAWFLLILGSLVSVAGNVAHAQPHGLLPMLIAAVPPLWLLAATHLTVMLSRPKDAALVEESEIAPLRAA